MKGRHGNEPSDLPHLRTRTRTLQILTLQAQAQTRTRGPLLRPLLFLPGQENATANDAYLAEETVVPGRGRCPQMGQTIRVAGGVERDELVGLPCIL